MLYFKLNTAGAVIAIAEDYQAAVAQEGAQGNLPPSAWARQPAGGGYSKVCEWVIGAGWINRNDMDAALAEKVAASASEFAGRPYLVSDSGECVSPRYDVLAAPAVGDEVSMEFNGDAYPVGKVLSIAKNFSSVLVDGRNGQQMRFHKKGARCSWVCRGFSLIPGVVSKWNPEF